MMPQGVFIHIITTIIMAILITTGIEGIAIIEGHRLGMTGYMQGHRLGMTIGHISIMAINIEIGKTPRHNEIIEVQKETEALAEFVKEI